MRILAAILAAVCVSCGRVDENAAITAGGRVLSYEEAKSVVEQYTGDSAAVSGYAETMLARLLILEDACARGLDEDPEVASEIYDEARSRLQYIYIQYKLGMVPVPEDTIRAFHAGMGEILVYTAIQSDDSLVADSLRTLIEAGADARDVAAANTNLLQDRPSAGRYGPTDRMRLSVTDGSLLEGLLPGELSRIVPTPSGWRFLKLDSLTTVEVPPLEEVRVEIRDFIWAHLSEEYKHTLEDSLVAAYSLSINPSAPGLIASHALAPTGGFSPYSEDEAGMAAYSWEGGERTVLSLSCNIRSLPVQLPRDARDPAWVADYCALLGLYDIMAARALELGLDEHPAVSMDIRAAQEDILLDAWYSSVIEPRILVNDQEIEDAWNSNRSMLLNPERRVFRLVYAQPGEQASLLASILAQDGDPFDSALALTVPATLMSAEDPELTRPLEQGELPDEADAQAFALEPGGVMTCSLSGGGMLHLSLEEILPASEASLEEARPTLERMLVTQRQEEALAGLVDSLKSAYAWKIDWDFFSRFWSESASGQDHPGVH